MTNNTVIKNFMQYAFLYVFICLKDSIQVALSRQRHVAKWLLVCTYRGKHLAVSSADKNKRTFACPGTLLHVLSDHKWSSLRCGLYWHVKVSKVKWDQVSYDMEFIDNIRNSAWHIYKEIHSLFTFLLHKWIIDNFWDLSVAHQNTVTA